MMPKPVISRSDPVEPGAAAGDFGNGSPFRRQREENDPIRKGIFIALAVVLFVFFCSMIAVLMMHAPSL